MTRPLHFRPAPRRPDLTVAQILEWADAFEARTGRWPTRADERVALPDTTWSAVDAALKCGFRGLNPGSSLAKLLLARRGGGTKSTSRASPSPQSSAGRTPTTPGPATGPTRAPAR